ncbi:MAG TPA: hypothetical protein VEV41_04085 [Terriglobales bacterium]|jgi:hypothetical protein|nr:hypothetical protein [Terriglobales bacterium]
MSKWTDIIDADVTWASSKLGEGATLNEILDLIAREKGRAYAAQEIQGSLQRIKSRKL